MRRFLTALRAIRLVHLRELRRHPLRTFIAVISVAAGVSMVLSVTIVVGSTVRSFEEQAVSLAGPAPLRIVGATSAGGVTLDDVETVRQVDGVASVVPMIRTIVPVERDRAGGGVSMGDSVLALGVDCSTATFLGIGCDALAAGPLVSDTMRPAVEAGEYLRTDDGRVALAESTVEPALDVLGERVAVFSIAEAQRLFVRNDGVDVAYVLPDDGADLAAVRARIGEAVGSGRSVKQVTDPPAEFQQVLSTIIPLFGILGLFALAVGMLLVSNTVALSLEERRQQLAVVAAVGGTGSTLFAGALVQAAVLGALGGLVGVVGAIALAYPLTASVSTFTVGISGLGVEALPSEAPVAVAVALGAVVAVVAAWRPARRARRSDVAAELSQRERREETATGPLLARALLAIAIGIIGVDLAVAGGFEGSLDAWQPGTAFGGLLLAIVALSFAIARVTPLVATTLLRRLTPRSPSLRLGLANLVREPARTGVMALAVGMSVGVAFIVATSNEQARAGITEGITAGLEGRVQLSIGPSDENEQVFARVPRAVVDEIAARPDVAAAHRGAFVLASNDEVTIGAVGFENPSFDLDVYRGSADLDRFAAGEVLVGPAVARNQGLEPGDTVRLPVASGLAELPVQGVWADGNFAGNTVSMPLPLLEELYGPRPLDQVLLEPAAGVSVDELAAAIGDAAYDPALRAESGAVVAARVADSAGAQLAPFWALQRGLTVVAFVAVLSTLLLVGIQRTRELGLLAAVGMTPRAIAAMVLVEAAVVGVIGTLVGAALTLLMGVAFSSITPLIIGWENPIRFAFWAVPVYGAITVVIVTIGAALPAWRAARVQVVEALAYE